VVTILLGLTACQSSGSGGGGKTATKAVTVGIVYPPDSFDPYKSNWGGQYAAYLYPVYDTLIRENPDGSFDPNLATSWKYVTPLEFELTLRSGVTFSDGSPVDAKAVKENLDRIKTVQGPRVSRVSAISSVEAVNATTVRIHLSEPNPSLPLEFSQLFGMIVEPDALNNADLATAPVGSGPYVLDKGATVKDSTYTYERRKGYWNAKDFPFDKLVLKVFPDQNSMLNAMRSGQVDVGYGSPDTIQSAKSAGLTVVSKPLNLYMLWLSDRAGSISPALGKTEVRQALNYAVDRDAILKTVFQGQGTSTAQIFPPGSEGYVESLDDAYPYDPDKAKQLLADAGYKNGFTFEVALPAASRDGTYAQAIAGQLKNVGVTMKIVPLPEGSLTLDNVVKYPAFISRYGGQDTFSDAKSLAMPPAALVNPFGSEDRTFNSDWKRGAEATDEASRKKAFGDLSSDVVKAAWFVPTNLVDAIYFVNPDKVKNVQFINGVSVPQIFGWQIP
jgi:peptide/nickel transport system substrate-binding protein